jgi:hypothetical protein
MADTERLKNRMIPAIKGTLGLFISPQAEVFQVDQSHINTVILNPEKFGITTQEIESAYAKHKEPIGVEGSAREEILCNLVMQGWIRLRRYIKPQEQWSITVNELNERTRAFLHDWATKMLSGEMGFREDDLHKPVVITSIATGMTECSQISEIAAPGFTQAQ